MPPYCICFTILLQEYRNCVICVYGMFFSRTLLMCCFVEREASPDMFPL